jgi:hypothetical protein
MQSVTSPSRLEFPKRYGKITDGKTEPLSIIDLRSGDGLAFEKQLLLMAKHWKHG